MIHQGLLKNSSSLDRVNQKEQIFQVGGEPTSGLPEVEG